MSFAVKKARRLLEDVEGVKPREDGRCAYCRGYCGEGTFPLCVDCLAQEHSALVDALREVLSDIKPSL